MLHKSKLRVLFVGESSHLDTGFGNYTKNVLSRLYETNKYDIAELSCYRHAGVKKTEPWKIYPVEVLKTSNQYDQYKSNSLNEFGLWRYDLALIDFKPDIVIDIRDYWNFGYQSYSTFRNFYKWIIIPTCDSMPLTTESFLIYRSADKILTHSEWAKNELENLNFAVAGVAGDSVDHSIFKPIGYSKNHHKSKFDVGDSFVIGTVMRNQKRKLFPELMFVFRNVLEHTDKNTILVMHTCPLENNGWDIEKLLLEYNIINYVRFTYKCKKCHNFWLSKYQGIKTKCHQCDQFADICSINNSLSQNELSSLYNIFDIYIQYANSEGLGIPQLEAASCGIPVLTINADVMSEIGNKLNTTTIDLSASIRDNESNTIRHIPNNSDCISKILNYIDMNISELVSKSQHIRQTLISKYSWDKTTSVIESTLDNTDISDNIRWDAPERDVNLTERVPQNLDIRDHLYFMINNIIGDKHLLDTYFIENIIKRLYDGIVFHNNQCLKYTTQNAIDELMIIAKNKQILEKYRLQKILPNTSLQSFFNYGSI